jgi:hypothetical protein
LEDRQELAELPETPASLKLAALCYCPLVTAGGTVLWHATGTPMAFERALLERFRVNAVKACRRVSPIVNAPGVCGSCPRLDALSRDRSQRVR